MIMISFSYYYDNGWETVGWCIISQQIIKHIQQYPIYAQKISIHSPMQSQRDQCLSEYEKHTAATLQLGIHVYSNI